LIAAAIDRRRSSGLTRQNAAAYWSASSRLASNATTSSEGMKLARLSLSVMAMTFLGLGLMSLTAPKILTQLVEITMPTPVAVMEIRGVYGGLFLGVGAFFLLFAMRDAWLRPGLVAQAGVMGGFVLGRTVGIVLDGAPSPFIAALLAGEVLMVIVALAAWRRLNLPPAPIGEP
jgi:hypothetical protein